MMNQNSKFNLEMALHEFHFLENELYRLFSYKHLYQHDYHYIIKYMWSSRFFLCYYDRLNSCCQNYFRFKFFHLIDSITKQKNTFRHETNYL